jgi:hypothetical protein
MALTVKKKIIVNGQEYHSLDELPPDVKALYDQAMASGTEKATMRRIVLNGRDIDGIDELPPEARQMITDALGGGKSTTSPIVIVVAIAGAIVLIALALLGLIK